MRAIIALVALLSFSIPVQDPMVVPKVEHKKRTETQTYDDITRSCPEGYEGHFVDTRTGFDWQYWMGGYGFSNMIEPPPGYTVCFKKEFMDKLRANPDMLAPRPLPPRGV